MLLNDLKVEFFVCRQILREIGYQAGQHELLADNLIKVSSHKVSQTKHCEEFLLLSDQSWPNLSLKHPFLQVLLFSRLTQCIVLRLAAW